MTPSSTKARRHRLTVRPKRSPDFARRASGWPSAPGFSGTTQEKLLAALGWQSLADLVIAPGDGVRGRPYPDLILTALMRLDVDNVVNVAVLGDTSSDVESALRAGASIVAGTLTGAHDERQLRDAGATHVVASVTEFADLILSA